MISHDRMYHKGAQRLRLRFKVLFWSGLVLFLVVTALASWGLFELREVMLARRSAYNMETTLHSMLESLQEADVAYLLAESTAHEMDMKRVVALVNHAHLQAVALTKIELPSDAIRKEIVELEGLIRGKVKTEDEYTVSGDMFEEPVVKKITTMKDNLVLTDVVRAKIMKLDKMLADYQSEHLAYVDEYFNMNLATITFGVLLSFSLFFLFARLVSREIDRRAKLEKELRVAQEAAISASALKSQFLATVSHEVRTPLNGIIGMSVLMREKTQGDLRKNASVIEESGRSLLRIVNDILDFSRMEADRLQLELQEVKLSDLFELAAELFSAKAAEKRLPLLVTYDPRCENLFAADGARISQILHNLVGNAIKFTAGGQITLSGEVLSAEDSEYRVRISVEDTGEGVSPDKAQLIFQPFQQATQEHSREGTGLGLSISKRLVEMMGGSIHFQSAVQRGSRFWIELPLRLLKSATESKHPEFKIYSYKLSEPLERMLAVYAQQTQARFVRSTALTAPPDESSAACCSLESVRELNGDWQKAALVIDFAEAHHAPYAWRFLSWPLTPDRFWKAVGTRLQDEARGATPSPSQALMPRGNGLVLLVEDNKTNQLLAQTQLEQLGYRVQIATNGLECLQAMQRTNFDLLLMDCRMPVMDGFEATRQIRERERKRQAVRTPIIAITANALEGDRHRCLSAGMDDYLTKPFDVEVLHQMMQKWIDVEKTQIDWRVVGDLANRTSNEVVKRLIHSFQNTLKLSMTHLESSLQQKNWKGVRDVAHQLKSSGAALGAVQLSHLCAQIEGEIETRNEAETSLCLQLFGVGQRVLEELSAQTRYT
jgi:two-component system sensor histidine kinase/response regulator